MVEFLGSMKTWKVAWVLVFPAVVYTVQNNLQFFALTYISATEFQLVSQLKTFTTAIFSVLFLGMRLSRVQWMAIVLLIIGVILAQLPAPISCTPTVSPASVADSWSLRLVGVVATVFLCLLSGAAGVYQEKVLKKQIDLSIHYLNLEV